MSLLQRIAGMFGKSAGTPHPEQRESPADEPPRVGKKPLQESFGESDDTELKAGQIAAAAGNHAEALRRWKPLAERGHAEAACFIGTTYAQIQNQQEAAKWYRVAAERGDAMAAERLGSMYINGEGVSQDFAKGVKWFRLAADKGYDMAQIRLGDLYAAGKGVPINHMEALKWYRTAAAQGDRIAQTTLGVVYAMGQGVPADYGEAFKWFDLAAAQGYEPAIKGRDLCARKLSEDPNIIEKKEAFDGLMSAYQALESGSTEAKAQACADWEAKLISVASSKVVESLYRLKATRPGTRERSIALDDFIRAMYKDCPLIGEES